MTLVSSWSSMAFIRCSARRAAYASPVRRACLRSVNACAMSPSRCRTEMGSPRRVSMAHQFLFVSGISGVDGERDNDPSHPGRQVPTCSHLLPQFSLNSTVGLVHRGQGCGVESMAMTSSSRSRSHQGSAAVARDTSRGLPRYIPISAAPLPSRTVPHRAPRATSESGLIATYGDSQFPTIHSRVGRKQSIDSQRTPGSW